MNWLNTSVERQWYSRPHWLLLLLPLTWLFRLFAFLRRHRQSANAFAAPVPVIVIGNIAVGGTGKTPTLIALCKALINAGRRPVVISRGYGARQSHSRLLPPNAEAHEFGDEPVLIARATHCPVVVGRDRVASVKLALEQRLGDIVLSDDGLQHYRLARHWEVVVIDSTRRIGNGWCLPVGPLREPAKRLHQASAVLINGAAFNAPWLPAENAYAMQLRPVVWRHIASGREVALAEFDIAGAVAVAGIGNPERFFQTLRTLGFSGPTRAFVDHHAFVPDDLRDLHQSLLLMTEKDAVKVRAFAGANWWALAVSAELPPAFVQALLSAIQTSP